MLAVNNILGIIEVNAEELQIITVHCEKMLNAMLGEKKALIWWDTYNKTFGMTAREQWAIDPAIVYNYLMSAVRK